MDGNRRVLSVVGVRPLGPVGLRCHTCDLVDKLARSIVGFLRTGLTNLATSRKVEVGGVGKMLEAIGRSWGADRAVAGPLFLPNDSHRQDVRAAYDRLKGFFEGQFHVTRRIDAGTDRSILMANRLEGSVLRIVADELRLYGGGIYLGKGNVRQVAKELIPNHLFDGNRKGFMGSPKDWAGISRGGEEDYSKLNEAFFEDRSGPEGNKTLIAAAEAARPRLIIVGEQDSPPYSYNVPAHEVFHAIDDILGRRLHGLGVRCDDGTTRYLHARKVDSESEFANRYRRQGPVGWRPSINHLSDQSVFCGSNRDLRAIALEDPDYDGFHLGYGECNEIFAEGLAYMTEYNFNGSAEVPENLKTFHGSAEVADKLKTYYKYLAPLMAKYAGLP